MDESTSLRKLALLPKLDPADRTLSHVRAQSAYLTFYASEGRTYMSSWRVESESNTSRNTVEKETAIIDIGTPVLKPRVKQVSKSVISVCSTKSGEKSRVKATAIVHPATTKTSRKRDDGQGADNGQKREVKSKRTKKKTQRKKKRKSSLSDSSSVAERLKERRERKKAKRAIVSPPSSSDKENVEEKRSTRKKMPVGFALMHGFNATNVGKNRLTVKPSVSIGVFNKGKASLKTKATKAKASGTKGHTAAYFSESMFLNKTKAVLEEDESSSISISTPSSGVVVKKTRKKISKKKVDDVSSKVSDIKSAPAPSSSPKKPSAPSIIWDIELGKSLCSIDPPISNTAPAEKLGSVILDVTRHSWAKLLDKCDPNQNKAPAVELSRPGTGSKDESEALASIGPSQSASQIITKITSLAKRGLQEAHHSKYFRAEPTKLQYEIHAESAFPPVPDDINHLPAPEEYEQPTQETNAADLQFQTEIPEVTPGLQPEPRCDCQVAKEVVVSSFDIVDQEQGCNHAEDVGGPIWTGHEEINCFDDPFGECVNLEDGEIPVLEQDYFMSNATDWELELESKYNFFQDCDFADDLTQDLDCFVGNAIHDNMEMDEYYDYVSIQGHEDSRCSEVEGPIEFDQNEDCEAEQAIGFNQNEDCEAEQAIGFSQDEDYETSGQCLSETSEKEDAGQVHRFSQGRALLSGCSMEEIGHSSKTPVHYPRLFLLEADVAKSLRDHWHPQRL